MSQESLAKRLRELARDEKARSATARLRDVFDDVEAALKSGVRREAVLAILNEQGFNMELEGFKSALQRIRKQRRDAGQPAFPVQPTKTAASVSSQGSVASESVVPDSSTKPRIENPGDLRKARKNPTFNLEDYESEE
jgi:hypothetical protein